jgi:hypothetical protein
MELKISNMFYVSIGSEECTCMFKLFGRGLHCKDTTKHFMYFTERNNLNKAIRLGKYRIKYLKKH